VTRSAALIAAILAAAICLPVSAWPADETPDVRAARLTREAAELVKQREYDDALAKLREAQEAAPSYAPTQEWLAHVYEVLGDKGQALNHVAALLALHPRSDYGTAAARRLFYRPPFPRVLNRATLTISPVRFTVDQGCALTDERVADFPARFALCYTTSLKYPEEAPGGGPVVDRTLPAPGNVAAQFNRVVYGYREAPDTGDFRLRVIAYYPSPLLSGSDTDLAPTAQALVHLMLRLQGYAEGYLGLPAQGDAEGINRLWLCLGGPGGAERQDSDVVFYRVLDDPRPPSEWIRQLAHECGHLVIPQVGGFTTPEMWGNGEVGERLFLYFLAEEAARWSGKPWPSAEAVAELDGLWPGAGAGVEDYLAASGRAPLAVWATGGPESELIMGLDDRATLYYVGLVLYVLAAHGTTGLRDVVKTCAGTTVADFVYAYRQSVGRWAKAGPLKLGVGCFNPAETKLTQAPPAAELAPHSLALAGNDSLTYPVFLPAGTWRLAATIPEAGAKLSVSFDGGPETVLEVTPNPEPMPIGPLNEGWHKLRLRCPTGQGLIHLEGLTFGQGPVA